MVNETFSCKKCQQAVIRYGKINCGSIKDECKALFKKESTSAAKSCLEFRRIVLGDYKRITLDRALRFILAGQAEFKIISGKTGKEFYYKVIKKEAFTTGNPNENKYIYWINGGENFDNMVYLGTIFFNNVNKTFNFSRGINGRGNSNSKIVISIIYLLNKLYEGKYNTNIEVYHNGNCGKCGKQLTEVYSILTGLDSECSRSCENIKI